MNFPEITETKKLKPEAKSSTLEVAADINQILHGLWMSCATAAAAEKLLISEPYSPSSTI